MSAASTPRSTRFDLPSAPASATSHTTTDSSLADWANKIRTLQRQVDADEEAEQRRLEEEIVRARLARQRRLKTGQSGDFGIGMHGINSSEYSCAQTFPWCLVFLTHSYFLQRSSRRGRIVRRVALSNPMQRLMRGRFHPQSPFPNLR